MSVHRTHPGLAIDWTRRLRTCATIHRADRSHHVEMFMDLDDVVPQPRHRSEGRLVGARGFEPLTSSASRKRSPPELSARSGEYTPTARGDDRNRTGVPGFADPCLNHSATSPCDYASGATGGRPNRAEDGARTRDLNLGKVALYQLSYFRVGG
jgi:hypothetical protein